MTAPPLVVTEGSEAGVPVGLEATAVEELRASGERWAVELGVPSPPLYVRRSGGSYVLGARHVTGFVRVGDLQIEIRPKFLAGAAEPDGRPWQRALWNALRLSPGQLDLQGPLPARLTDANTFADLLAESFLASVARGSARGLPRRYVEHDVETPGVRGRLRRDRPVALLTRPWALPCRVSQLSEGTPVAQLLRWAAVRLARLSVSTPRARALLDLAESLGDVAPVPPAAATVERMDLGTQYAGLALARDIGLILLRSRSLEPRPDSGEIHGVLWVTHRLFEGAVRELARRAALRLGLQAATGTVRLGERLGTGADLGTTPDVRVLRGGRTVLVLDAKYKVRPGNPAADDVYQVIAGAHAARSPAGALVYPSTLPRHDTWRLQGDGPPWALAAVGIDLLSLADDERGSAVVEQLCSVIAEIAPLAQIA